MRNRSRAVEGAGDDSTEPGDGPGGRPGDRSGGGSWDRPGSRHGGGSGGSGNVDETTAAELPDGRVCFDTRNDAPSPGTRADARSRDGGRTLVKPFRPQAGLVAPVVECSVLQLRDPDVLLLSDPADPGFRAPMTLRASTDGGTTWQPVRTVDGLPAAYSDLVRVDARTVGLLHGAGDFGVYGTITFRRVPVTRLTRSLPGAPADVQSAHDL